MANIGAEDVKGAVENRQKSDFANADMVIDEYLEKKAAREREILAMIKKLKGEPDDAELAIVRIDAEQERIRLGIPVSGAHKHLHWIPQRYVAPTGQPPIRRFCSKYGDFFMYACGYCQFLIVIIMFVVWWHAFQEYNDSYSGKCQLSRPSNRLNETQALCRDCLFDIKALIDVEEQSPVLAEEKREEWLDHVRSTYSSNELALYYTAIEKFYSRDFGERYREFRMRKYKVKYNPYGLVYYVPEQPVFKCCPQSCCDWLQTSSVADRGHCDTTVFTHLQTQHWRLYADDQDTNQCNTGAWDCTLYRPVDFDMEVGAGYNDAVNVGVPQHSFRFEYHAVNVFWFITQLWVLAIGVNFLYVMGCILIWTIEKKSVAIRSMMADRIEETILKIRIVYMEAHPKFFYRYLIHYSDYYDKKLVRFRLFYGRRLYMRMTRIGRRFWYGVKAVEEQEKRYLKADRRDLRRKPVPVSADMMISKDDCWTCCTWWCPCFTFSWTVGRKLYHVLKEEWRKARGETESDKTTTDAGSSQLLGDPIPISAYEMGLKQIKKPFLRPRTMNFAAKANLTEMREVDMQLIAKANRVSDQERFLKTGGTEQLGLKFHVDSGGEKFATRIRRYYKPGSKFDRIVIRVVKGECIDLTLHKYKHWKNPDLVVDKVAKRRDGAMMDFHDGPKKPEWEMENLKVKPVVFADGDPRDIEMRKKLEKRNLPPLKGEGKREKSDFDTAFSSSGGTATVEAATGAEDRADRSSANEWTTSNKGAAGTSTATNPEQDKTGDGPEQDNEPKNFSGAGRTRNGDDVDDNYGENDGKNENNANPAEPPEPDDLHDPAETAAPARSPASSSSKKDKEHKKNSKAKRNSNDDKTGRASQYDTEFVKHPRVLHVRACLAEKFGIQPNSDALARVNDLIITTENWHLADYTRPCELEFLRIAPEWLANNPKRKFHIMRKTRTQLRHKSAPEIMKAVSDVIGGGVNNPVLFQLEKGDVQQPNEIRNSTDIGRRFESPMKLDYGVPEKIEFEDYIKDPVEKRDYFDLNVRYDYSSKISAGDVDHRGVKFRDLVQERKDRRRARREAFGHADRETRSKAAKGRKQANRKGRSVDPEIEVLVKVENAAARELLE
ncbi:unnamed protein product [Amoebophrya sp. A120]|nr:unnamed protein product [Amoebophrya sp. A120]|eukprot:GSA120T00013388001.1